MQTCSQAVSPPHTHTRTHTPFLALYHRGLSCCLSNQCMGSFQLQWSEHFIPFLSFPLLNTQTHKYMPKTYAHRETRAHSHTHTHTDTHPHGQCPFRVFLYARKRRGSDPRSISKRLMCLLGQNEILCHYKVLRYRTPE